MFETDARLGDTLITCDGAGCGETLTVEGDAAGNAPPFGNVRAVMADYGWASRKENGEWHHYCPACHD